MKIDVGSGGYGYSGPAYYARRDAPDAEVAEDAVRNNQNALNISRSPMSASLANALWAVERERKATSAKDGAGHSEEMAGSPNGSVLERYLEFAVSSADEYH